MSAYDLAVVARNALAVPEIADTVEDARLRASPIPTGTARHFTNHNKGFLTTYPGATGLKTGFTDAASRTLVTSATRNGRTMIAVVMGTWDDTGWAGYLLDQGFATPATAPGTGEKVPPVRAVTADARRAAFKASRRARARRRSAARRGDGRRRPRPTAPTTTKPKASDAGTRRQTTTTSKADSRGAGRAQTRRATTDERGGSGSSLGSIFNLERVVIVVFVVLLALFLLRRRAVRRQRARRIARQKRMAEIRRRRMIDVVDPAAVEADEVSHVRVVPTRH